MKLARNVQPSALHPSPLLHRRDLPPIVLARVFIDEEREGNETGTVEFVVTTPEVRCRILGALIWVPTSYPLGSTGQIVDRFWPAGHGAFTFWGDTALWLAKRHEAALISGVKVPTENVVGNIDTPRVFPDPGCLGCEFEAETYGDELWGRLFVDASLLASEGVWVLRAAAADYTGVNEVEWNRVLGKFAIRALNARQFVTTIPD